MLTRLEVRGFKNLVDVSVEFGPFTCVAGENAVGKSNLFDAIEFLSLLADHSLMEAAQQVRATAEQRMGDPRDLFWDGRRSDTPTMSLAAEMVVPSQVEDDFGQPAKATITFLRYEVEVGLEPSRASRLGGQLVLLREAMRHINLGDAHKHLRFQHSAKDWRRHVLIGRRSGTDFISTEQRNGEVLVKVHQDGGSRGQPRVAAAARAPATVVRTTSQADDPTILAARREMQSWRRLALEPSAMRATDGFSSPQVLAPNGRHLAATLFRVANLEPHPEDVYARVAARLSALTGVHVPTLRVEADDKRESLTLILADAGGVELPARSLSEGTLRFLALCVLLEDPTATGLFCMEEPENGIHPASIPAMVDLVRDLAVDPYMPPGEDNPARQVIVNTHSPSVVQLIGADDLLFADVRPVGAGAKTPGLRVRPMAGSWRAVDSRSLPFGKADLIAYLAAPPGAQLTFGLTERPGAA